MTYKQTINDFINSRYQHLTKYATTILFQNNLITPTDLISELYIYLTENNRDIVDPFMGSGTTGVACVQTGRRFVGIEIDPGYFEIAVKRIKQAQLQIRMEL